MPSECRRYEPILRIYLGDTGDFLPHSSFLVESQTQTSAALKFSSRQTYSLLTRLSLLSLASLRQVMLAAENILGETLGSSSSPPPNLLAYHFTGVVSSKSACSPRDLITSGLGRSIGNSFAVVDIDQTLAKLLFLMETYFLSQHTQQLRHAQHTPSPRKLPSRRIHLSRRRHPIRHLTRTQWARDLSLARWLLIFPLTASRLMGLIRRCRLSGLLLTLLLLMGGIRNCSSSKWTRRRFRLLSRRSHPCRTLRRPLWRKTNSPLPPQYLLSSLPYRPYDQCDGYSDQCGAKDGPDGDGVFLLRGAVGSRRRSDNRRRCSATCF